MPEHTIAENLTRLQNAKTAIGNAITAKGGTVGANDGLEDFASDIASIPSGGGVEFSNSPTAFRLLTNIRNLDVVVPSGITSIGEVQDAGEKSAFYNCEGLRSIIIPNTVTLIGDNAFNGCKGLTSIELPNSITTIRGAAFSNCINLERINLPNALTFIGGSTFSNCAIRSLDLPNTVTTMGASSFSSCSSLESIKLSTGLTVLNASMFSYCINLKNIEIPNNITSIGNNVFQNCTGLEYIKFTSVTPPTIGGAKTFQNVPTTCIIYVPSGSLSDYTSAQYYPDSNTYTYVEY